MMKKMGKKLTALLLALSMLLPAGVFAATTYSITVTLAGPDHYGVQQKVERTSSKYGTLRDPVLGTVAQTLYLGDDTGMTVDEEVEEKYDGTLLRGEYYALSKAAMAAMDGETGAWTAWVNTYVSTAAQKRVLLNTASTFADLADVGGLIYATYEGGDVDGGEGFYTVTIRLNTYTTGGGGTKPTGNSTVFVDKTETGGTTTVSDDHADPGDKVIIYTNPDERKITGYVTVRDKESNKLPLTYEGKGDYSFTMPDGPVEVNVSYRPEPVDPAVSGVSRLLDPQEHIAFMQGYKNGEFRPSLSITRAQVAAIFYRLLSDQNVKITKTFSDVPEDYWANSSIGALASLGILKGITEETFAPNKQITRAQFAAICARFAYAVNTGDMVSFTDVPSDYWAYEEIEIAVYYGWLYGYDDGRFDPNAPITRAQAAAIMNRMLARLGDQIAIDGGEGKDYTDVNDNYWAWYDIQEASTEHEHEREKSFYHEFWDDVWTEKLKS